MESRDPIRIEPSNARPERAFEGFRSTLRFPLSLDPPAERRQASRRIVALAVGGGLLGLGLVVLAAWYAVTSAVGWLRAQPEYQLTFREIVFQPDLPSWYRGSRTTFLDKFPHGRLNPGPFSTLDLDLAELERLIKQNPIVRRVRKLQILHPRQVVAELEYADPVAFVSFEDGQAFAVDSEGLLLPVELVQPETLKGLISFDNKNFPRPSDPHPGEPWKSVDPSSPGKTYRPDPHVAEAARLAGFLKRKLQTLEPLSEDGGRRAPVLVIHLSPARHLYVQYGNRVMIRWTGYKDDGSGYEHLWAQFRAWLQSNASAASNASGKTIYYRFGGQELEEDF
jgi:hypothetical protein